MVLARIIRKVIGLDIIDAQPESSAERLVLEDLRRPVMGLPFHRNFVRVYRVS